MSEQLGNYLVPVVLAGILLYGVLQDVPVFDAFVSGARTGVGTAFRILPTLIALTTAVGMLKASGAMEVFCHALTPVANFLQLPPQVMPLALLRPISGSSAMVVFEDILQAFGPDGYIGRVASVLMGSTETTFYTMAVYYGATRVKKTRHSLPSSLAGDIVGFLMSGLTVRLFLGL